MMKKLFLALAFALLPTVAFGAACDGIYSAGTLCGAATSGPMHGSVSTGTSGHTLPYLDGANTWSGVNAFPTPNSNISTTQVPTTAWVNTYFAPIASPSFTGTVTVPVTGSTQCLHVNSSGQISGSGADCSSTTNVFTSGLSFGPQATTPGTADFYGKSNSRSLLQVLNRDQVLSRGNTIGELQWWGQNASAASVQWGEIYAGPSLCRGRTSIGGFPCATTVVTSGSEEGTIYLSRKEGSGTVSLTTNAITAAGSATLNFASSVQDSGNLVGKTVTDVTTPSAIPAGTYVAQETATTIVMSNNAAVQVGSGDTIHFDGPDIDWFDANGLNIAGQRNVFIPAGYGVVSFDKTGMATYIMSYNSHAGMSIDFQSCNNIGVTCSGLGATPAIRFYTSAAGAGQPAMQINYDSTIVINFLSGSSAAGSHALCLDSSNRLFKAPSASAACP